MAKAIVLMGVSGCGKTSVGRYLAESLNWPFYDGDDYHPEGNIAKMSQGIPLNDGDRHPWLVILNRLIAENLDTGKSILLACSALKQEYRNQLADGNPELNFVYLRGDFETIYRRISQRTGHYMQADMLRSQFAILEEPTDALVVEVDQDLKQIVEEIRTWMDNQDQLN